MPEFSITLKKGFDTMPLEIIISALSKEEQKSIKIEANKQQYQFESIAQIITLYNNYNSVKVSYSDKD
jgi:phosphotransferase system HPr-like phosphotransfer protein